MRSILAILLLSTSADRPDTVVSPWLDSGITSSNGGGTRALGNNPDATITARTGPAR